MPMMRMFLEIVMVLAVVSGMMFVLNMSKKENSSDITPTDKDEDS